MNEIFTESGAIYKPIDATTIDTSSITDFKISRLTEHEKIDLIKNQYNQIQENLIKLSEYDSMIKELQKPEFKKTDLIKILFKLLTGELMSNWRTTLAGIITAIMQYLLQAFQDGNFTNIKTIALGAGIIVISTLASDAKKVLENAKLNAETKKDVVNLEKTTIK